MAVQVDRKSTAVGRTIAINGTFFEQPELFPGDATYFGDVVKKHDDEEELTYDVAFTHVQLRSGSRSRSHNKKWALPLPQDQPSTPGFQHTQNMMEEEVAAGLEKMAGMTMPVTFKDSDGDVIKLILAAGNMQLLVNGEEAIDDCTVLYRRGNTIADATGQRMELPVASAAELLDKIACMAKMAGVPILPLAEPQQKKRRKR